MCEIIIVNKTKEVETIEDFKNVFGMLPVSPYTIDDTDQCLCHCDIEETFKILGIEYKKEFGGDFLVDNLKLNKLKMNIYEFDYTGVTEWIYAKDKEQAKEYCSNPNDEDLRIRELSKKECDDNWILGTGFYYGDEYIDSETHLDGYKKIETLSQFMARETEPKLVAGSEF